MSRLLAIVLAAWTVWAWAAAPAASAAPQNGVGRVPVRVVAGKLVLACDASSPTRRIPVNLFVEYETPAGLQLHNRAAFALRLESADGQPTPVKLHLPGFDLTVPKREHGDEEYWEEFTKYHSHELGENAVVGVIGAEVLDDYHLVFDLAHGMLEVSAPREAPREVSGEPPAPIEGTLDVALTEHAGMIWLPVRFADGEPAALAVGTARYDTVLDTMVCEERDAASGEVGPLTIGGTLDITRFVALRPEEVVLVHPDGVAGVSGLNLLEHFRVELDRVNRLARLTQTAAADFPAADLAFFRARVPEEATPLEAFLDEHPDARLAHEAAELLLEHRLAEEAGEDEVGRALRWIRDTTLEDLRATRLLDLMGVLSDEGHARHVVSAGELGIEWGRKDRYPNAIHEIHSKMGGVLLELGEDRPAWKHLLSAAFGLPEDGMVNLNLGRYYERVGRHRRAFSRYVQACIKPESGPAAIEALERVQPLLPDEDPFSVDLVERMVAGKVKSFATAGRFEASDVNFSGRITLVEFFTNAYLGDGDRGAIGGALGNQGLLGHFPPENVAFLSYHLTEPSPDPLVNELGMTIGVERGLDGPYYHVINGTQVQPGAARWRQAEAVYNACKKAIQLQLIEPTDYALEIDASVDATRVSGTLTISGPERDELDVHLVLAEAGVLFPGKTEVVVHRMVARAALTDLTGTPYEPDAEGRMSLRFDASFADVRAANEAWLDELEERGLGSIVRMSTRIDPAQVRLVAYVRDASTGEVLQALSVDPPGPDEERQ